MNKLFNDLDKEFDQIVSPAAFGRIGQLVKDNFPSFVTDAKGGNSTQGQS